ncbi:MAG: S9 family peptidase [Flammeovirgaceae bacterium]|nr:S9 family peptidase [Flammeovirgaceae bacterium]
MRKLILILSALLLSMGVDAQKKSTTPPVQKQPLNHDVYDGWKTIPYKTLTPDGSFAVYLINPQDGDGKVIFHNLKTNASDSVQRASDIKISSDGRFAVFKINPQQELVKELRREKKKKDELPKDSLGIYTFATRKIEKIPNVKSFRLPEKGGAWTAYLLDVVKENKGKDSDKTPAKGKAPKKNSEENGYTLVVKNLADGKTSLYGYAKDYKAAKYGQGLLFSSTGNDSTMTAGMFWLDATKNQVTQIHEGHKKFKYKGLSVSEDGTQSAFLLDADTSKAQTRFFQLHYWKNSDKSSALLATEKTPGVTSDWIISENYTPRFSKDGSKLFLGTAPKLMQQDTTLLPEEIISVEVWTADDEYIYPMQNVMAEQDKKRSFLAVIDLSSRTLKSIGSPDVPQTEIGQEGNASIALGESNVPYRKSITWMGGTNSDLYIHQLKDGSSKKIASGVRGNARLSPDAKHVFWFNALDTAWYSYSLSSNNLSKLSSGKIQFADELNDQPDYPGSYGFAGWTKGDNQFLANDRYDIWAFDPENKKAPENLTKIGRKDKIVFRYNHLNPDEEFIDPNQDLILSAFNEVTKASGYYKLSLKDGKLTKLIMDNYHFSGIVKAKNANQFLFERESFTEFGDIWTSDNSFSSPKKLSTANPQQKNYYWGNVELVKWTSLDGLPLEGLLYKPEGFDPSKKYPMMVYFYERNSDNLYRHHAPAPIRSSINYTYFTSNGYVVFVPDVVYKIGFPGESAHNCILPGVTSLISKGFVDEKRIGVQGHSWGGYQIAYLITRTNIFAVAEAGAPVVNMISAYGGVRWQSGMSRMFQYERSQTRLGGSLWEKPMLYIENSPIFFADKIQTPVLMMHNDADGAVPWYQGIEFYMALRRLDKPVWMLNYNKEAHGLQLRQNRKDFAIRMYQYFDHYLKDAPAPEWMTKGVPAIEKGINKGY